MPEHYYYSRRVYHRLHQDSPDCILLLESEDRYWTYNESAEWLAEVLHIPVYRNHGGQAGLQFLKGDLLTVESRLDQAGLKYRLISIIAPKLQTEPEQTMHDSMITQPVLRVEPGKNIELKIGDDVPQIFYFSPEITLPEASVDQHGLISFANAPEVPNAQNIITVGSDLGRLLLGKTIGACFSFHNTQYTILNIT